MRDRAFHRHPPTPERALDATIFAILIVLVFLIGTDIFDIVVGPGNAATLLKLACMALMAAIVAIFARRILRAIFAAPELTAFVALAATSAIWSVDRATTLEYSLHVAITTATAMLLASMASLRTLLVLLGALGLLITFGSLLAVAGFPSARGAPPWDDTWRGIFNHKNGLGTGSLIAMVATLAAAGVTRGTLRAFMLTGAAVALFLLLMSESRTSQIVGGFALLMILTGFVFRRSALLWATACLFVVLIIFAAVFAIVRTGLADPVFDLIGRRPTLSGRLPLWEATWPYVQDRFLLGYGFGAFWDTEAPRVLAIARDPAVRHIPYYSHNGLIEVWLNVGLVGVLLLAAALLRIAVSAFAALARPGDRAPLIGALVLFVTFLMLNILESSVLSRMSIEWMTFIMISTKLCLVARSRRRAGAPPLLPRRRGRPAPVGSMAA